MIWNILRVIGIILLCILALILVILFLVLLAPIRYRIMVDTDDGYDLKKIDAKVTISWLLILKGRFFFSEGIFKKSLKILFFEILKDKNNETGKKTVANKQDEPQDNKEPETVSSKTEPPETEAASTGIQDFMEQDTESFDTGKPNETFAKTNDKIKKKKAIPCIHIADLYAWITETIDRVLGRNRKKIRELKRNVHKIVNAINDPSNRDFVILVLKEIRKLLKLIWFKKHKIYVKLGLQDPSLTGEIYGAYSVVNSIFKMNFLLEPDFDEKILIIKAKVSGQIRLISIVIIALKVVTHKTFRKIIRRK